MAGQVLVVPAAHVDGLWPLVAPLVASALRGSPTHEPEDVRDTLLAGRATLIAHLTDEPQPVVQAIAIVEIVSFPKGRWLNFWLVAARNGRGLDVQAFAPVIDAYRTTHGCRGFQIIHARRGWVRKMKPHRVEGVSARWTFDG